MNNHSMKKKGQVFLLGAIVIVLALLTVTGTYNSVKAYPDIQDYKENTANYLTEYPKVVNDARYNTAGGSEIDKINVFSRIFVNQAKTKDPNFGVAYMYKDDSGNIKVVNTLNNQIITIKLTGATPEETDNINVYGINMQDSSDTVCINGIDCSITNSDTRNFGGRFSNDVDLASKLQGKNGIAVCLGTGQCTGNIPIGDLSSQVITSSQTDSTASGNLCRQGTNRNCNGLINVDVTVESS